MESEPAKTFADVIDRAIGRGDSNRCSVAARWGSTPESLYRWQNNDQSPKFNDLRQMLKRMNSDERADVYMALFGAGDNDRSVEIVSSISELANSILEKTRELHASLSPGVVAGL